jgi:hypothetical protein
MELTDSLKTLLIETAKSRKGSARRFFMARTVKELGPGGQPRAARERRWGRRTMRKGRHELDRGVPCVDAFALRGRKRAAEHLPNLLTDIHAIVDSQSQAAPQFRTTRLYTRLTAAEGRRPLIAQKGYPEAALPTAATINPTWNALGYSPQKVAQSQPQKNAQKLTPSAPSSLRSSGRLMPQRRSYACRWRPRRLSQSGPLPGVARAASRRSPPTTTFTQTRP